MTTRVGLSDSTGSSLMVKYERISSGSFFTLETVRGGLGGGVGGRDGATLRGGVGVGDGARLGAAEQ